jgi:hypothetical protein
MPDRTVEEVDIALSETDYKSVPNTPITPLPAPSTLSAPRRYALSAAVIIPIWIVLSSSVITYNNWVYNTLGFKFPVFLVTWHLLFATIGTRVLQRTTHLLDGVQDVNMTKDLFLKSILPIGVLFSGSLVLSNTAYLYLSVSFIQMLKACISPTSPPIAYADATVRHLHLLPSSSYPL